MFRPQVGRRIRCVCEPCCRNRGFAQTSTVSKCVILYTFGALNFSYFHQWSQYEDSKWGLAVYCLGLEGESLQNFKLQCAPQLQYRHKFRIFIHNIIIFVTLPRCMRYCVMIDCFTETRNYDLPISLQYDPSCTRQRARLDFLTEGGINR